MLFNSIQFLIFFPVVTALYFMLPYKYRWALLLLASCIFYMAFIPVYILILFVTILIDYLAAIYIENHQGVNRSTVRPVLIVSIVSTCVVLFVFKYLHFFTANYNELASFFRLNYPIPILKIILPIGLSFHTFQSLSYVIEVYKGRQKAERNLGIYASNVMFYPQLVAGPIERPQNLLHQFYEPHDFDYQRVTDGLKLMTWGLFKKMLIADRVAVLVNQIYDKPTNYEGISLLTATFFFAVQIYCDFSGYSDIAIGAAKVMGFNLMTNFKQPYFSESVAEFWRRWHISLSTWFKDYVYIPLGGNKVSPRRRYFNLFVTFVISGLWHGANWTYIIWGALHGFYITFSYISERPRRFIRNVIHIDELPWLSKFVRVSTTFVVVCFAWIFFRANSLGDGWYIVTNLFTGFSRLTDLSYVALQFRGLGLKPSELTLWMVLIAAMLVYDLFDNREFFWQQIRTKPLWLRWSVYYFLLLSILFFSDNSAGKNFIYFQF